MVDSRQTILVVDDDPNSLKLVIAHLRDEGHAILIARDGQTGLERARQGAPDLILLDVTMPGIDGFEVCQLLSRDPATRDIPVIFMSGRTEVEDRIKGYEVGGADYVSKPIERRELLARVRVHLKLRRQTEELARYTGVAPSTGEVTPLPPESREGRRGARDGVRARIVAGADDPR